MRCLVYRITFTKTAFKDFNKLNVKEQSKLKDILLNKIDISPLDGKHLIGDLKGFYSVRLNFKDRIVYSINETDNEIFIHRVKTHYGE